MSDTTEEQQNRDAVINAFNIDNSKWKPLKESNPDAEVPYWLKLENGNVVLAAYANANGASGWWKVFFSASQFMRSSTEAYIAKGAKIQPCELFKKA